MLHQYVTNVTRTTAPSHSSKEEFAYMIACAIGSTIGVLHKWIMEDFRSSPETIADILTHALRGRDAAVYVLARLVNQDLLPLDFFLSRS